MRSKVDERRHFYSHEKKALISKSKGKCAHCGKKISLPSEMTVDHVIPLIKGGTNDMGNLVILCEECNKSKGELVMLPSSYFRYLTPKYKSEVDDAFDKYCREVGYFTGKNYLFADSIKVPIQVKLWINSVKANTLDTVLFKAMYSDLDELSKFCEEYYKEYSLNIDVHRLLSSYFDRSAIYFTRSVGGSIDFVFFVMLESTLYDIFVDYSISVCVMAKPGLSVSGSRKKKASCRGYYQSNYSNDFSVLKLNSVLKVFLRGVLKTVEDSGISSSACVSVSWYEEDTRVGDYLYGRHSTYSGVLQSTCNDGIVGVPFTSNCDMCILEDGTFIKYDAELDREWNKYIESIYSVEDEIELYSVIRDKKYEVELLSRAKELREKRARLGVGTNDFK